MINLFRVALCSIVAVPIALWIYSVGDVSDYFGADVPQGQLLYVISKLLGLIAITLVGLQVTLVHLRQYAWFKRVSWSKQSHKILGLTLFIAVCLHVGLFVSAASLRSGHVALGPLSIRLSQGFYDQMISLGAMAFYLMVVVVILGMLIFRSRKYIALKRWHGVLVLLATTLAMVHSVSVGSETRSAPMLLFYGSLFVVLVFGVFSAFKQRGRV